MKRTLPVLFATILLVGFACTKKPAVIPPGPPPTQGGGTVAGQKQVNIIIDTVGGNCVIFDPGDVYLKRNVDKIKWCIEYRCSDRVIVIVDDFKDSKTGPVTKRNPFGDHSDRDNTFDFGPLNPGGSDCTKLSGLSTITGRYYYRIIVLSADGRVIASQDPGVIIGD